MFRRAVSIGAFVGLVASSIPAGVSAQLPPFEDHLRAYSIVPPGQEGNVTAAEFAAEDYGDHYDDQLETYASLIDDDDVTEEEIPNYFHSMQFGSQGEVERTYSPIDGTTVERDELGIPHIDADSMALASFALGYVSAEDRLWQMDVFRHAARGTLAAFVGPDYLEMDIATRREGYTEPEIMALYDTLDERFGGIGATLQEGLQNYADGVNAYIEDMPLDDRPVEYEATGNFFPDHPEPWTVADTLFLVVLQLREFGETAGTELQNAALLSTLRGKLGKRQGRLVYDDLVFQNEPKSYSSVRPEDGLFPHQRMGKVDWASVAIPDQAEEIAEEEMREQKMRREFLEAMGFKRPASNALIVSGDKSRTGNPMQIGAPQVGYSVPQFFMDIDVHAPGVDFRGPAVPGASALVPLGRGRDYAWTLTTGYSDAVDTRAELLCEPDGSEPTTDSEYYMFDGECLAMDKRTETFEVNPPPTDPGFPSSEDHTFYRTIHGPVSSRGTVDGAPVAFVKQRNFWMRELDSLPPFYKWNTQIENVEDFAEAAGEFTMSFNSHYVDKDDIGYFHVGKYPVRAEGTHPSLPIWGTGEWEWQGEVPFSSQPKVINPSQGWLVNWNNKAAKGWDNLDGIKWGSIHRVELLADEMKRRIEASGTLELSDLVDVIRNAATQDVRGLYLGPKMLKLRQKATTKGAKTKDVLDAVGSWVGGGAHRMNRDRDGFMDESPAVAFFDRWYVNLVHQIFDDDIGAEAYEVIEAPVVGQSMWFDFSSYVDLILNKRTRSRLNRDYCDVTGTEARESCKTMIVRAWRQTMKELVAEQGEDPSAWTAPAEWISHSPQGAGSVPDIPWQNRGTHNHVVEVLSDASD